MSKTYDEHVHTFVWVKGHRHPLPILLRVSGDRTWVAADHSIEVEGAIRVGDGLNSGYDEQGNYILSVPNEQINSYMDSDDAMTMERLIEADDSIGPTSSAPRPSMVR
jgi:hypothetical protein